MIIRVLILVCVFSFFAAVEVHAEAGSKSDRNETTKEIEVKMIAIGKEVFEQRNQNPNWDPQGRQRYEKIYGLIRGETDIAFLVSLIYMSEKYLRRDELKESVDYEVFRELWAHCVMQISLLDQIEALKTLKEIRGRGNYEGDFSRILDKQIAFLKEKISIEEDMKKGN